MAKRKKKTSSQKPAAKASNEDEVFYVGLHNPAEIRRNLLEASRDVVQFLQRNEKIKEIRKEKVLAIQQLRTELHQLRLLVNKLKKMLPKTNLKLPKEPTPPIPCTICNKPFKGQPALDQHMKKHQPKKEPQPKEEKPVEPPKPKPKPHHLTELERLESELNDIEQKLEGL